MATTASSANEVPDEPSAPPSPFLRRVHRRVPNGVWYTLAALGFAVIVVLLQLAFYMRRAEPRDARAIVEREFRANVLEPGERLVRSVPVYRRNGADYYRQTRGLLALTDRRLVYLGAPPRDITGSSDAPPTFDQRVFRIDTLTDINASFAVLGFSRALVVESPTDDIKVGIPSGQWPKAKLLQQAWAAQHRKLATIGIWGEKVRRARTELKQQLDEYRKQPVYHVVRPGDAISAIASWYETSIDSIAQLNGIVNNRIRVGQRLLIRKGASGS
jgi:hypothetical protein